MTKDGTMNNERRAIQMSVDMQDLGRRVREAREAAGASQNDAATAIGVSQPTYYRIESGDPYFEDLRSRWSNALRAAHLGIPRPPYDRSI